MQLSGPTWYVSSASVFWLSLLAVDKVSPRPACGCQEEEMLADVYSPSSLVAEAETKLFKPADKSFWQAYTDQGQMSQENRNCLHGMADDLQSQ